MSKNDYTQRFIKFIPSEEALYLQEHETTAFLLLCHIATRARRTKNSPDGLEIGEALIGDYKKAGIPTEMKYRTAKQVLERRKHVKIVETARKRKKATTGITTKGTKVKLLRSDVWDINEERINDQINERITTEQRPSNDEQECKECKNVKNTATLPNPQKIVAAFSFLEDLGLSKEEIESLMKLPYERSELERRLIHAIEFTKGVKIKESLIATLIWATKELPVIKENIQVFVKKNFVDGQKSYGLTCEINPSGICFYGSGQQIPFGIKFKDKGALVTLKNWMMEQQQKRKYG